jgi:hypothetical protein
MLLNWKEYKKGDYTIQGVWVELKDIKDLLKVWLRIASEEEN